MDKNILFDFLIFMYIIDYYYLEKSTPQLKLNITVCIFM